VSGWRQVELLVCFAAHTQNAHARCVGYAGSMRQVRCSWQSVCCLLEDAFVQRALLLAVAAAAVVAAALLRCCADCSVRGRYAVFCRSVWGRAGQILNGPEEILVRSRAIEATDGRLLLFALVHGG
jgi:hypothetical protein